MAEALNASKDRQNFSAMQMIEALRKQRRDIFFGRSLSKKIAFFPACRQAGLFLSFGEAKERKDNASCETPASTVVESDATLLPPPDHNQTPS